MWSMVCLGGTADKSQPSSSKNPTIAIIAVRTALIGTSKTTKKILNAIILSSTINTENMALFAVTES